MAHGAPICEIRGSDNHSDKRARRHSAHPSSDNTTGAKWDGRGIIAHPSTPPIRGSDKKPGQNGTAAILAHPPIQPIPIQTTTTSVSATDALKPVIFADSLYFLNSTSQNFARKPLTRTVQLYYHQKCTHMVPDRRIRATIKSRLDERTQDQYVEGV